jgi:hypothetical protein
MGTEPCCIIKRKISKNIEKYRKSNIRPFNFSDGFGKVSVIRREATSKIMPLQLFKKVMRKTECSDGFGKVFGYPPRSNMRNICALVLQLFKKAMRKIQCSDGFGQVGFGYPSRKNMMCSGTAASLQEGDANYNALRFRSSWFRLSAERQHDVLWCCFCISSRR